MERSEREMLFVRMGAGEFLSVEAIVRDHVLC